MWVLEIEPRPLQEQHVLLALEHLPRPTLFSFQDLSLAWSLPSKVGWLASGSQRAFLVLGLQALCVHVCMPVHTHAWQPEVDVSHFLNHSPPYWCAYVHMCMHVCVCMCVQIKG